MSRRTATLFLLTLAISIPLGVQMRYASLPCATTTMSAWTAACQSILGYRAAGTMFLYCAPVDPSRVSTAIYVIAWVAFLGAAAYSATLDIAEYFTVLRRNPLR